MIMTHGNDIHGKMPTPLTSGLYNSLNSGASTDDVQSEIRIVETRTDVHNKSWPGARTRSGRESVVDD